MNEIDPQVGIDDFSHEWSAPARWDERLARWVSLITSPPLIGLLGLILTAFTIGSASGWIWAGYYSLITIAIPVVYILWKVRHGEITDFHMIVRAQRIRPMFLMVGCALTAWLGLWLGGAPIFFTIFGLMGVFQIILLLGITLRWKISGHSAAISSMAIFLWGLYGVPAIMSILAIPLVAWSRVRLHRHTLVQTIAGSIAGVLFMLVVFGFVSVYCHETSRICTLP